MLEQITDSPGCSDCVGGVCEGSLFGQWYIGDDLFTGYYWVSGGCCFFDCMYVGKGLTWVVVLSELRVGVWLKGRF